MSDSREGYRLKCSMFLVFMLFCQSSHPQTSFGQLDQFLQQNQKALGSNVVALVWKDGKMIYQKQLEKETGDFNAKYQAPIGSTSEWMTAALVMTFVDEGKLSLDDKVSKYIPLFATYMKTYITIRNCLTNTTGIQADPSGPIKILQKTKFESLEDEVNSYASKREIEANPGTQRFYSHVGPNIAGRVLEIISKRSFDRLMQERIIRPLKMRGTTFSDQNGGAVNPSGGGLSTASDYMNFLIMLLNKGMFEGKRVLSEKSVAEMESPQFAQLPVKFLPKTGEGQLNGLGNWIQPGNQTVVSSLNTAGTWPLIDKCHNYAAILFVKSPTSEPRHDLYQHFKTTLDGLSGACQ